jgi:hypothetical protein
MAVIVEEMQELLLTQEEELTRMEEALIAREEKARISKKALAQVSAVLDTEQASAEATQWEYIDKIQAHTDHGNQVLNLDKMLGERKEELNKKERDLELPTTMLE